jgi:hypothetical protein
MRAIISTPAMQDSRLARAKLTMRVRSVLMPISRAASRLQPVA